MIVMRSSATIIFIINILNAFVNCAGAQKFQRICETQGTCINCGDDRYSYYQCRGVNDCFSAEVCTKEGFCCPFGTIGKTKSISSNQHFEFVGAPALNYQLEKLAPCPDGSSWLRQCATDSDCIFGDEICAENKCCSVCSQRRRQVLNDLPTNNVVGVHIPLCEPSGKHYRAAQCRTGTEECWCVSQFGRIIGSLKPKTTELRATCEALRLALKRSTEEEQKIYQKVWEHAELRRKQENVASLKEENDSIVVLSKIGTTETKPPKPQQQFQSLIKEIRNKCKKPRNGQCPDRLEQPSTMSNHCYCDDDCAELQKCCPTTAGTSICFLNATNMSDQTSTTSQPSSKSDLTIVKIKCPENEHFVDCVNECEPNCSSQTSTICSTKQQQQCTSGCRCKPGFVRQNNNPHALCIQQSQCPRESLESTRRCTDPLREYLSCGPACPISCTSQATCKIERCVEGCFCKIPYILENGTDLDNSKCILPAQCPLSYDNFRENTTTYRPSTEAPMLSNSYLFPEQHYQSSISRLTTMQCSDPLKNFQMCGSGCPAGCNNRIAGVCGTQCVAGCFCRSPYILQDAYNMNSRCVLPHQCQSLTIQQQICSDPRKQWTNCFSPKCVRSCSNPDATCPSGDCAPGCLCREPYLLFDLRDPNSRCVLPSECNSHCSDPLKEFQACASSCPIGCNNRIPQTCSPCVSGCFCKLGLVFEDAVNWRTSKCIPLNQCPSTTISPLSIAFAPKTDTESTLQECPSTTVDLSGRFCNFDSDCPAQQRCCRSSLFAFVNSQQSRCTCPDPHAYWDPCGTLCPEYCNQPAVPVCSSTCNPGCHCSPGYVKARNDIVAPCVLRTQCLQTETDHVAALDSQYEMKSNTLLRKIATARMLSTGNKILGDIKIIEINKDKIKLRGTITGLPDGEHALIVHQSGDLSDSCANTGPAMVPNNAHNVSAILGNLKADKNHQAIIDREVNWPQNVSLIGHSLVIHKLSVMEWSLRSSNVLPLACGTIGFAS